MKTFVMFPNYHLLDTKTNKMWRGVHFQKKGFFLCDNLGIDGFITWDECTRIFSKNELGYILYGKESN